MVPLGPSIRGADRERDPVREPSVGVVECLGDPASRVRGVLPVADEQVPPPGRVRPGYWIVQQSGWTRHRLDDGVLSSGALGGSPDHDESYAYTQNAPYS